MNEEHPPTEDPVPEERDERAPDASGDAPSEPDWLRDMSGDQESPDWLRRLLDDEQAGDEDAGPPSQEMRGPEVADPDEPSPAAEPEGAAAAASAPAAPAAPLPERSGTDDLRQWFRATEDGIGAAGADREDLPEWLQALDVTPPATEQPERPSVPPALPAEESVDLPDWLRDMETELEPAAAPETEERIGARDGSALPDWLTALDDGPKETAEPDVVLPVGEPSTSTPMDDERAPVPFTQEPADDLPDWLQEMTQEMAGRPEELEDETPEPKVLRPEQEDAVLEPERALGAELLPLAALVEPDEPESRAASEAGESWADLEPGVDAVFGGDVEPGVDVEPVDGAEPAADERIAEEQPVEDARPAAPSQEDAQVPLWLAELEREPEAEVDVPDWLAEAREETEPEDVVLDLLQEEQGEQAKTPRWMHDLRSVEDAGAVSGADGAVDEPAVETSGPLAGLAGLLSPQLVAGLSDRAVFKPALPVPDEQHALAARIRELLSEPPARPELPAAAPGRPVMRALGHWLIYLALVAVIVAAMFVPALYERILPLETPSGQDVYVTLRALPAGSEVLLVIDYDASHDGELTPLTRALLWHLVTSGQRVVVVSHTPQGAAMAQDLLESRALWAYGPAPTTGVHTLNLGYLPPHLASMQAFMANPVGGAALWGESTLAGDTPLGQEISRFDDLDAIVIVSASQEHTRWWIEQTAVKPSADKPSAHSMPMLVGVSASIAPSLLPYGRAPSAQLSGMLVGLAGAAEYERLSGARFAPSARQNVILLGSAQMLLAAIVLVSGISLLVRRAVGRKG